MNDSPGWTSPGSTSSDDSERGVPEQRPAEPPSGEGTFPPADSSAQQPPPGQWTAPTGPRPGPTPQAPPPGHPGWGRAPGPHSKWAAPAIAKPGVIPLRPLGVTEILDGAVSTMRAHWRTVLGVSFAVALVVEFCSMMTIRMWLADLPTLENTEYDVPPSSSELLIRTGASVTGDLVNLFITMLGTLLATAILTMVVSRAVLGRTVTFRETWRSARPQLPRLLGLFCLLPLLTIAAAALLMMPGALLLAGNPSPAGGALLLIGALAAIVVAVWIWIRFSLAAPALMLEKQGVINAMRRSAKLVRGAWWRIFGIQLLTVLLVMMAALVIQLPMMLIGLVAGGEETLNWLLGESDDIGWVFLIIAAIGAVISSTITLPISASVNALLYVDQRIRREALDLELGQAAGLPGYGPGGSGGGPVAEG
ncbi:DUF7544 domain-containing protein [Streptomyces sp. TP-A0874]|uniref:DUF7544 domain-containing protein n=1 Tax=Streptomyces sp. TP-A0874 TaxID=549819 RepID=UPI000852FAF4|nr:hypothetical protein [Streptomyces sp. TP-A0874]